MLKTCRDCGYTGLNFESNRNQCKECRKKYKKAYDIKNKKKHRNDNLRRKYGLEPDEYERMLEAQGGGCKACGYSSPKHQLCVDHDHESGEVRGILCPWCNSALGYAKDSIRVLAGLIMYMREYEKKNG